MTTSQLESGRDRPEWPDPELANVGDDCQLRLNQLQAIVEGTGRKGVTTAASRVSQIIYANFPSKLPNPATKYEHLFM
jgi:hypothetical protein